MYLQLSPDCQSKAKFRHLRALPVAVFALILACLLAGCASISPQSAPAHPASSVISPVSISPSSGTVNSGSKLQFVATTINNSDSGVIWSTNWGVVLQNGLFTAPSVSSPVRAVVMARSVKDSFNVATAVIDVLPQSALAIATNSLAAVSTGAPYSAALVAQGGTPPYQWRISRGSLPRGLSLDHSSGTISGTALQTGSFGFTASVSDANSTSATRALLISVDAAASGNFDGPAELPRVYVHSSLSDTPAPGRAIPVLEGGDLQAALNNSSCGDTIEVQPGATFSGVFSFPAKGCDDNHWIIVRTAAPDSALPPEGTRITPCYAGVDSLPGRPPFNCATTQNVMAKLVMNATGGSGPIVFASGAAHYRLIGLEITRQQGASVVNSLASVAAKGTMDHIVFDRVWMHGTAQAETTRGVELGGSTFISIIDSFFTDFHCVSITGSCGDSQAIYGGIGDSPMGPYRIVNNFLEASGENILFGGGSATVAPADIEIRRNHMFKPLTWMKGQPGYVGGVDGNPFIVKNLFELKNAQRVLLDGNIMENSWGGFTQVGFAILLTPKNQAGGNGGNLCPDCQVTDVTIRNVMISHVAAGMQIANGLSDNGGAARAGARHSIHDVIIDDIDGVKYGGPGEFAQVSMGPGAPVLQDVTINHVTAFPPSMLFMIGDETDINPRMKSFVFTNSIVNAGAAPVWSTGLGGTANCAVHDVPFTTFNACFEPYTFASNAIVASPWTSPTAKWPSGNFFPAAVTAVQFANYNGGNGGDYHLRNFSPFKGAGTDGKDLGADVDTLNSAIAGVR